MLQNVCSMKRLFYEHMFHERLFARTNVWEQVFVCADAHMFTRADAPSEQMF